MIQAQATARYVRTSAQKAGLVMELIRGKDVNHAVATLRFTRKAIADDIQKQLKADSILPLGVEGTPGSGWILLDYNGVIVHLLSHAMRDYYELEKLWSHAPVVVRMQ